MAKSDAPKVRVDQFLNADGSARDMWPTPPTRPEAVEAGFPCTFPNYDDLVSIWSALTIDEKERLGFTRVARIGKIERMIALVEKKDAA